MNPLRAHVVKYHPVAVVSVASDVLPETAGESAAFAGLVFVDDHQVAARQRLAAEPAFAGLELPTQQVEEQGVAQQLAA